MNHYKFQIALLFLAFSVGCNNKTNKESEATQAPSDANVIVLDAVQEKNAEIQLGAISNSKLSSTLRVYGRTFFPPENMLTVTSPYGGIIKSIQVIQGQSISKGQTIAILEDPRFIDLQQDYLMTKSKLKLAQLDYDRQKDLNQAKANSDKVYQIAENEYRTNQILLKSLSEKLKLLGINPQNLSENSITRTVVIRSTASGLVSNVNANMGKYIMPSESIVDIINQTNPYLKLKIYEKDLQFIHKGMRLKAYSNSDTTMQYSCEVRSINPQVAQDGSAEVVCSFINMHKTIYQNMNLIAQIELSNNQATSLPDQAIVDFEGQAYVFLFVKNGQYKMIPIQKGNSENGRTEILNPSEILSQKIVTKGAYTLLMAMKNKEE